MVSTAILLVLLVITTITDVLRRKIYNSTTYPGILLALAWNAWGTWVGCEPGTAEIGLFGWIGIGESLVGFAGCGFVMLVCYVFFPGVGGGDIKLLAMIGAFLGLGPGLEAMLWTFILAGCLAILILIWQFGSWTLLVRVVQLGGQLLRFRPVTPLTEAERARLKTDLYLSPSAMAAVLVVQFQLVTWL